MANRDDAPSRTDAYFHIGEWLVRPDENALIRGERVVRLEPKVMAVLEALAAAGGGVLSVDDLLRRCWRGTFYGDSPVRKAITQLRQAVDDSPTDPRFIATVHKRGYRLLPPIRYPDGTGPASRGPSRSWVGASPFRGLAPFGEGHAAIFFGRSRAIAAVLAALDNQHALGSRFVVCVGLSGAGKTSLLQAGVVPALKQTADRSGWKAVADCTCTMARDEPFAALTDALLGARLDGEPLFHATERAFVHTALQQCPQDVIATLADRLARRVPRIAKPGLIVLLDDLDGLFQAEADVPRLVGTIAALARSGVCAVLAACRSDAYPVLGRSPALMALKGSAGHVDVGPPDAGELAAMVRLPAQLAGLAFEHRADGAERLDDVILGDAGAHPECLPLLQYALSVLYAQRSDTNVLTFASYAGIGGLAGAIASQAEAVFAALPAPAQSALPEVLGRLIVFEGSDGAPRSRPVYLDALPEQARALCEAFVNARLFVLDRLDQRAVLHPTHDALLRHWTRVTDWVQGHRTMLLTLARVRSAALHWEARQRASDLLLARGLPIEEGRQLQAYHGLWMEPLVGQYIDRSLRRRRRGMRLRRALAACLLVLAAGASAAGWLAWQAREAEARQREQAERLIAFIVDDLNRALAPLGRIDLLDRVGQAVSTYLAGVSTGSSSDASARYQAEALLQLTDVRIQQGQDDKALALALRAQALLHDRVGPASDGAVYRSAGAAAYWIGYLHYRARRLDAAREAWAQYGDLTAAWLKTAPDDLEALRERSYALNNLAVLDRDRGAFASAAALIDASVALKRRVLDRDAQDRVAMADLADSLSWQGSVLGAMGRFGEADARFREALELIGHARNASTAEALWTYREATVHLNRGLLALDQGNLPDADRAFAASESRLREVLQTDPDNADWQRMRLVARQQRAWTAWLSNPDAAARDALAGVLHDIDALGKPERAPSEQRTLRSVAHSRLALALLDSDPAQALAQARTACELMDRPPAHAEPEADQYARALAAVAYGDALSGTIADADASSADPTAAGIWRDALASIEAAPIGVSLRVQHLAAQLRERLARRATASSRRDRSTRVGFASTRRPQPPALENP